MALLMFLSCFDVILVKATRHIMCCRVASAITGDVSPDADTGPAPASNEGAAELEIAFGEVAKTYEPVWFTRVRATLLLDAGPR